MNETFTLGQVSADAGVSVYTLRRICDRGLIRGIKRGRNGYRMLNSEQVEQVLVLAGLLSCGMGWKELKVYARLLRAEGQTAIEQKAMLATKKRQLWQQLEDLQQNIDFIERREEILEKAILAEK